jgi:hypothetical protein
MEKFILENIYMTELKNSNQIPLYSSFKMKFSARKPKRLTKSSVTKKVMNAHFLQQPALVLAAMANVEKESQRALSFMHAVNVTGISVLTASPLPLILI